MDCKECSGLLIDYMEDMLGPEESGAVEEHLRGCPDCTLELGHYREISTAAREGVLPEVSAEVLSSLSEAARKSVSSKKTPFWKKWSYSPILVPTISAAIALSVWFYYGQTGFQGADSVTREVGAVKMRAPETREEMFGDSEENEKTSVFEKGEPNDALIAASDSEEKEKPPAESRIAPASPFEPQIDRETSESAPAKSTLRKKDVTEEDLVTYREEKSASSDLLSQESAEQPPATSSDEAASESLLKAGQPILRDYTGELKLAQRQQARGDCEASIKTNETLLNSSPPPPMEVQAASYRSLAECYEQTGDVSNAVASYNNLARVDPGLSGFVSEKLEEMNIDSAFMNYEDSGSGAEPAN